MPSSTSAASGAAPRVNAGSSRSSISSSTSSSGETTGGSSSSKSSDRDTPNSSYKISAINASTRSCTLTSESPSWRSALASIALSVSVRSSASRRSTKSAASPSASSPVLPSIINCAARRCSRRSVAYSTGSDSSVASGSNSVSTSRSLGSSANSASSAASAFCWTRALDALAISVNCLKLLLDIESSSAARSLRPMRRARATAEFLDIRPPAPASVSSRNCTSGASTSASSTLRAPVLSTPLSPSVPRMASFGSPNRSLRVTNPGYLPRSVCNLADTSASLYLRLPSSLVRERRYLPNASTSTGAVTRATILWKASPGAPKIDLCD